MKYFYEYKYKNGGIVGGHNLEQIEFRCNYLLLNGFDIVFTPNFDKQYWCIILDMNEIEYLKINPMQELEECDNK